MEPAKAETRKRARSNKTRCISCRKCYNSGLCLMPWPGFGASGKKTATDGDKTG